MKCLLIKSKKLVVKMGNYNLRDLLIILLMLITIIIQGCTMKSSVSEIFKSVKTHNFYPLDSGGSRTQDSTLGVTGIADLNNEDWKIRTLAVRDLIRAGIDEDDQIIKGLYDQSIHIKQVSAMALGILRAEKAIADLEHIIANDDNVMVRCQAIIALGQMESTQSLGILKEVLENDPSRDIKHQCELAIDQIKKQKGTTDKQLAAYLNLDEKNFETIGLGSLAQNFILEDTNEKNWSLNEFNNKKWVVLIWVFADWCPVCHGEFQDLMKMKEEFEEANTQIFTLECHDLYRGRVMVGKELDPTYWFSKESFQETYTEKIWWPHLLDRAGTIAAMYGADPLTFSVHAEYINRPTTIIIDPQGIVRFSYKGTYWGDRPSIEQTLEMIKTQTFDFVHPKRLK